MLQLCTISHRVAHEDAKNFTVVYLNQKNRSLLEIEPRKPEGSVLNIESPRYFEPTTHTLYRKDSV